MSPPHREPDIGIELAVALIAEQFPDWAELPISAVEPGGWDNRTFRLGKYLSLRLPSAGGYASQVEKEHRWLPHLAPRLPLDIPAPIARGAPHFGYPWAWSVYGWLDGETAGCVEIDQMDPFASDLAEFLMALQSIDPTGGPPAGAHSAYRGAPLAHYDDDARGAIGLIGDEFDAAAMIRVWEIALDADPNDSAVWFHGDIAVGNLLVREGRLSAVIDFGCCGVGDPACDYAIAWTLFRGSSRVAFREALAIDDAGWERGRGWALWKAAITVAGARRTSTANVDTEKKAEAKLVLKELLDVSDHDARAPTR